MRLNAGIAWRTCAAKSAVAGVALLLLGLTGCGPRDNTEAANAVGNSRRGAELVSQFGCGSCHSIPRVANANGRVGPPLDTVGERTIIAGVLPNTPENLIRWVKDPQSVVPGNAEHGDQGP
jgi:cytochrome c2